ncbi:MAG: sulfate adenylyltransferase subunit CysN [Balneolaceae bacterium]
MSQTKTKSEVDHQYLDMDLLRFTTAGSVDDGKSTLIGRLLYDSKSIFEDQWDAIETSSQNQGDEEVNLALLTDGLRAEREQGITIDVAYRYFATPKRKFIIADTPGHIEYTRNMVTGASTADLAIILIDARKGVLTQSKRHSFLSSLLQIPHLVVAVNKMDLVDYSEERFNEIVSDFQDFSDKLEVDDITYIPISALYGDNVVNKQENMPWYQGSTLLHHLEHVKRESRLNLVDFRFPVQYVVRPNQDFRGFAGRVASGTIRPGEQVTVLPSEQSTTVERVVNPDGDLEEARAGDSIVLTTTDEVDISRGSMVVRKNNVPTGARSLEAALCWMNQESMELNKTYLLMQNSRTVQATLSEIFYKINIDTMHRETADRLQLNEIGRVKIDTAETLYFDPYKLNNSTGSFILIDPDSYVTVAAGMIRAASSSAREMETDIQKPDKQSRPVSPDVTWEPWNIPREAREKRNGHKSALVWLTGISGAGKSTIAKMLEQRLWEQGKQTVLLDGDQIRHGLCGDLGFSEQDRSENIRRVGEVARLFFEHGNIVLCTFVSPYREDRQKVFERFPENRFIEVHVHCETETAQKRDPKGLYEKAKQGEIKGLTGYDAPYEEPSGKHIRVETDQKRPEEIVDQLVEELKPYLS